APGLTSIRPPPQLPPPSAPSPSPLHEFWDPTDVTKPLADSAPVDLTNCDREPIHILAAIQPIGFLIALTADWLIARGSANVAEFIGRAPDDLFGQPLDKVFSPKAVHDLRNRSAMLRGPDAVERLFNCTLTGDDRQFDVA